MFERYTEQARRVIFFARYEASNYGSPCIETEHILLGLLREDKEIFRLLPRVDAESIRKLVEAKSQGRKSISTAVDLPLSDESKRVLKYAAEEADRLNHKHIGTEHLLPGLLRETSCFAANLLCERGADLAKLRTRIEKLTRGPFEPPRTYPFLSRGSRSGEISAIEIHGVRWDAEYVHDLVKRCHENAWQWNKRAWKPRDIVIDRKNGKISFDLILARKDSIHFELVKKGWKKDYCVICRWELFESKDDTEHGTGYTNGREWLCMECYDKFWQLPNFISSSYSDIT